MQLQEIKVTATRKLYVDRTMNVVLSIRSLSRGCSISARKDESAGNESAARMQGEVFSIFCLGNFKAYQNCIF